MKNLLLSLSLFLFSSAVLAQTNYRTEYRQQPTFTYDVGAASGSYNGSNYSEINLGLNWFFMDSVAWRNSLFTRFGSGVDSATGVDTSLRYTFNTDPRSTLGLGFFAGGGYRLTKTQDAGPFAEGGLTLRAGGLSVGVGLKEIFYPSPGTDSTGTKLPDHDSTVFLILAGGGAF
jgi:hypothetical protein